MVDNIQLDIGAGGDTLGAKDEAGIKRQEIYVRGDTDSYSIDAFGRWRVSQPVTIFESKLLGSDDAPLFWDEALETGAGITATTPTVAKPYIDIVSTVSTAGKFTRQTKRRFPYQPGKSAMVMMTGVLTLSGGGTGGESRIGLFDDDNGLFFEDDQGVIGVTIRSNDSGTPADTTSIQTSWNIDNLDGDNDAANPSGVTADWSKAQIFVIDYQWLSIGRVRFGVEIGGKIIYVHEVNHANINAIPYMSTPNLPLRYQLITTASTPATTLRLICATFILEGGQEDIGILHSHATIAHVNANTADTVYALLGIRLKTTHLGCTIKIDNLSILAETADNFEWQLILNPTVAGTFTYAAKTNSCVEIATGDSAGDPSTNTVTVGTIIARGFGAESSAIIATILRNSLSLGALIDGTRDEAVLAVRPLAINADIQGSLNWLEIM